VLSGCPPPDYQAVDLQVDLLVDPDDDPFDQMGSTRVCLISAAGDEFELFPRDPGSYLVVGIPEGAYDLVIQGFDLDSALVRDGETPAVIAHAEIAGAVVATGATPGYLSVPFALCGDSCPVDCATPATLGQGGASIGLRRVADGGGGE
jgi:hypothetical protein